MGEKFEQHMPTHSAIISVTAVLSTLSPHPPWGSQHGKGNSHIPDQLASLAMSALSSNSRVQTNGRELELRQDRWARAPGHAARSVGRRGLPGAEPAFACPGDLG